MIFQENWVTDGIFGEKFVKDLKIVFDTETESFADNSYYTFIYFHTVTY